ncbi:MAG TPA: LPXTG cell wall anchor domain-containing protein, partial [bacterium]|nr:LPXTG cell wall anchor domain-containing protein [bacterium]
SKLGSGVAFGPDGKKLADGKAKGLQIDMTGAKDNTIIYLVAGLVVLVAVYLVIRRRNKRRKK